MPELPEVETSRRGIEPYLAGARIERIVVRCRKLRWPVPRDANRRLAGQTISSVRRRAKYLLIGCGEQTIILHLGMSGSVFLVDADSAAGIHDHIDVELGSGLALRLRDPRRFGAFLISRQPLQHKLLKSLGPEPLSEAFNGNYLWSASRGRRVAVKQFIMNAHVVVGVGNIYASEALFLSGIHPKRAAGRISRARYGRLAETVRQVLERAIDAGGTTLRDFYGGDGEPGYFAQQLAVYDRAGQPCRVCDIPLRSVVQGQRSTYYCVNCQT